MPYQNLLFSQSQPAWAAWIEIKRTINCSLRATSQPAWAAWIEIEAETVTQIDFRSQPAWAAWIEMIPLGTEPNYIDVAARMGCVDWHFFFVDEFFQRVVYKQICAAKAVKPRDFTITLKCIGK